ncbi:ABC transporter substrate-binding protein [Escherichia coli]|uniref:ABC transporter substrate-binding protein n=1 Tax=Escherichia coli TaxID=562 RepID=A0A376U6V8_ECOLX|nr:ABC transporter substrate-binding protein [Escherichia coli]
MLSLAGGDTAVTIKAAAQQTSGVNAAMAYGTDGPVAALGLQTLSDPQGVQPIYAPAPVCVNRVEGVSANGTVATASLRQPRCKTLQQLNAALQWKDWMPKSGCDYLKQKGWAKYSVTYHVLILSGAAAVADGNRSTLPVYQLRA